MKTKLSLSLLLSLVFGLLSSQVPQGFNYQAVVRNSSGLPVINQTLPVRMTIQSDSLGGTIIWQELHSSVVTTDQGVISLVIGKGVREASSTVPSFSGIDWGTMPKFLKTEINFNGWKTLGVSRLWSVPYALLAGDLAGSVKSLAVEGETSSLEEALFEVKNREGQTVFAVYNEGVRIYVSDGAKAVKGGFAVGGFGTDKAESTKYLFVGKDSVRIYLDNNPLTKGIKSGFAVGGYDLTKGTIQNYLDVSSDSVRIYIDSDPVTKKVKGGFAVGGYDMTKGSKTDYLNVASDVTGLINPSQNRILWYPLKNAFLTGKVLIENPDSVGINSFASGYESKAKGIYSQALGYRAIARGDYSTAIGKNSVAHKINSFAFGENALAGNSQTYALGYNTISKGLGSFAMGYNATATGQDAFAMGSGTEASGTGSYAIGFIGRDSAGLATGNTKASGDWAVAIGMGAQALMKGALSVGTKVFAENEFSLAIGYSSQAKKMYSTAIGSSVIADGFGSAAIGFYSVASDNLSYAFGSWCKATGNSSLALGGSNTASGVFSTAAGFGTTASGNNSTSLGDRTVASGLRSTAMGFQSVASEAVSTAMGWGTLASGYGATAIGVGTTAQSLYSTVVGTYNEILGSPTSNRSWDPVFVVGNGGSDAYRSSAFTVVKNGNIGIKTSTPQYMLDITAADLGSASQSRVQWFRLFGNSANQDQLKILHRRFTAGTDWTSSEIRLQKTVDVTDMGYISFKSDYLEFGLGTAPVMTLSTGRYVGIAAVNPGTYRLYVSGTAYSTGGWTSSDIRWKKNIVPVTGVLEKILALEGVTFEWKRDEYAEMNFDAGIQLGLIAQQVEKIVPEIVKTDTLGFKAVSYEKLSVLLLQGMKEQQNQIDFFKAENDNLRSQLRTLQEKVGKIEVLLSETSDQ